MTKCDKCHDTEWYQYSSYGTPHYKPCEKCCKHDKGRWQLKDYYGTNNGKWCCLNGCGALWDNETGGTEHVDEIF